MKGNYLLSFVFILFSGNVFAQENLMYEKSFPDYAGWVSKKFGISANIPGKFNDLNQYYVIQRIREDKHAGSMYGPVFKSKDKNCIVMYPAVPQYFSEEDMETAKNMTLLNRALNKDTSTAEPVIRNLNDNFPRSQITSELKAAIGLFNYFGKPLNDSVSFNFNDYVTILSGKEAVESFNADSIFFYNIPLEKAYEEKYTHCTGMVVCKKDRATMQFKFFFTTKGRKKEEEYIRLLSKQLWYEEDFRHE